MKKKIYLIENGFSTLTMSGGTKNFIEITKRFLENDYNVVIITDPVGQKMCTQEGLINVEYILSEAKYKEVINPYELFFAYIKRGLKSIKILQDIIKKDPLAERVFIYASEIYSSTLALMVTKQEKQIVIFNMVAPNPFLGYSQKLHIPKMNELHYFLSNIIVFVLLQIFARKDKTTLIATSENIKNDLINRPFVKHFKINIIPYGVDKFKLQTDIDKVYDFAWIGRNHAQKGIDDLEKILLFLKKQKSDFTVTIIGDVKERMENFSKQNRLEKNLIIKGQLYGDSKYIELSKAKVFLFTSHFESFGIVVIENMLVRNLVVGYEIPSSLSNFPGKINFVPKFDEVQFANIALDTLSSYHSNKSIQKNFEYASALNWENSYCKFRELI